MVKINKVVKTDLLTKLGNMKVVTSRLLNTEGGGLRGGVRGLRAKADWRVFRREWEESTYLRSMDLHQVCQEHTMGKG